MTSSKAIVLRFFLALAILVLLGSTTLLAARAARPQSGQWNAKNKPLQSPGDMGRTIKRFYLPIVQRSVCGEIKTDTIWEKAGNPYRVTCDVIVSSGGTLTIGAGVMVQFEHLDDDLIIYGKLQVAGTKSAPITFQPLSGMVPGSWGRIAFMASSSGELDHTILEYGGSNEGMVYIASDGVQVVDSVVQYSANTGIYIHDASPLISGTQILTNTASISGGGLYNDTGSPLIQNNTFRNNSICHDPCFDPTYGGGLYNDSGNPTIQNNIFIYNFVGGTDSHGGGLHTGFGSPIIQNNIFSGNAAVGYGWDHWVWHGYGGGLFISGGSPIISSNIVVNNTADYGNGIASTLDATPTLGYNDVWKNGYEGITPGQHDISADPGLVDPTHGDFHLSPDSPCRDTGDRDHYPKVDFDGDPRPMGAAPDIGVDEYRTLGVTKNGTLDEASPGGTITYTVTIVNLEVFPLTDVLLTDTLPIETAFTNYQTDGLTCTHDGSPWGGVLSCALDSATLAPGESQTLTLTVKVSDTLPLNIYVINPVTVTASSEGETFTASDRARTWVSYCEVRLNDILMGRDLQAAIDASTWTTDVVKVSGYCHVHGLSLNKTLILQGGWSPAFEQWDPAAYTTTLNGQGLGQVIEVKGDINPTIEGFLITGGKGFSGGGISISSGNPTVQYNTLTDNQAYSVGGGLYNDAGSATIQNNTFAHNSGGGLYTFYGSPSIQNNTFNDNSGPGLYNSSGSPIIQNNTFADNSDAGLYNDSGSPMIQNNNFTDNSGPGLYNGSGSPMIQNNNFSGNSISGLRNAGGSPTIQNNIFTGNSAYEGGGLANYGGSPIIQNNSFTSNSAVDGGGIYCINITINGSPTIRSNILVSNTASSVGGGIYNDSQSVSPTLDYNDVWNNIGGDYSGVNPGPHDISANPLLVNPANGDFHLAPGSPCIDAGDPVSYPETDFEGDPRPQGLAPDIGADEFLSGGEAFSIRALIRDVHLENTSHLFVDYPILDILEITPWKRLRAPFVF